MSRPDSIGNLDYFTDDNVLRDPYSYFSAIRSKCPHIVNDGRDILFVTDHNDVAEALSNAKDFSSSISPGGPVLVLPFDPDGDDITDKIECNRDKLVAGDLLVALDDMPHSFGRSIVNRLFVPSRLKENEEFIFTLADQIAMAAVARGECEMVTGIATPFVTMVIADLLGVPEDDREKFRRVLEQGPAPGSTDSADGGTTDIGPLVYMAGFFYQYLAERREQPRDDVLSELAATKYPDGSTPEIVDLVKLATFLFGAGQDTSAKLLGTAMLYLCKLPEIQSQIRADRKLIGPFIEEVLRMEGSTKATFRLARRQSKIGNICVKTGQKMVLALAAANRDPARWEEPDEFRLGRPKIHEHLAFGRGKHVCSGAPLARVEIRIIIDRFLEYTSDISLDDAHHSLKDSTTFEYDPSYIIRGLKFLHLRLTPSKTFIENVAAGAKL